ncbi:MAG: 16S rRNA (guanine(527)-N(7))-methyltransferase RsmG [Bacteroidales bacterium]
MNQQSGSGIIEAYFPDLSSNQTTQFGKLEGLYSDWNKKVNVISRKDIGLLYERHVLHSLAIARFIKFSPGTTVLDVGTGGGFPGIPLAVYFPEVHFFLTDSIAKKIKVVESICHELGLKNVSSCRIRSEEFAGQVDFVVSRAVAPFPELVGWCEGKIRKQMKNSRPNGIICLKGGDLSAEIGYYRNRTEIVDLQDWFTQEFFKGKRLVYMPL